MIHAFEKIIAGEKLLPKERHHDYGTFFQEKGYKCLPQYCTSKKVFADEVFKFYTDKGMSGKEGFLETISLEDVYTVSLLREQIVFAASFFVADVGRMKIGYITNLKVKESSQGQGMGANFLKDLKAFMEIGLTKAYTKAYLVLNAVPSLEKYYTKRSFSKAASFFSPW